MHQHAFCGTILFTVRRIVMSNEFSTSKSNSSCSYIYRSQSSLSSPPKPEVPPKPSRLSSSKIVTPCSQPPDLTSNTNSSSANVPYILPTESMNQTTAPPSSTKTIPPSTQKPQASNNNKEAQMQHVNEESPQKGKRRSYFADLTPINCGFCG